jgi:hypothetical protein
LANCVLNEKETNPANFGYSDIASSGAKIGTGGLQITLAHKGSDCPDASKCNYVFVMQNINKDANGNSVGT